MHESKIKNQKTVNKKRKVEEVHKVINKKK